MKKLARTFGYLILATLLSACFILTVRADESAISAEEATAIAQGLRYFTNQGWTTADLLDSVRCLRQLYLNDNKTATGRVRWHGAVTNSYTDVSNGVYVTVHADGKAFTNKCSVTLAERAARASAALLGNTNGVPAALAAIRAARATNGVATNTVDVTITAGEAK